MFHMSRRKGLNIGQQASRTTYSCEVNRCIIECRFSAAAIEWLRIPMLDTRDERTGKVWWPDQQEHRGAEDLDLRERSAVPAVVLRESLSDEGHQRQDDQQCDQLPPHTRRGHGTESVRQSMSTSTRCFEAIEQPRHTGGSNEGVWGWDCFLPR